MLRGAMRPFAPILAGLLCALASAEQSGIAAARPIVFVSIPPQAWIVEQLCGRTVDLRVMLPASAGHVNYSPAPSQIRDLAGARLFVRSGLPFETSVWERLRQVNPRMAVIDPPEWEDADDSGSQETAEGNEHEHGRDPHFWLNEELMIAQAESIAAALPSAIDTDSASVAVGMERIRVRLKQVDAEIQSLVAASPERSFWTFHASWGHFAGRYGIEQHAIEFEGKEAGLRTMLAVVKELESSGARYIVVEPGLDRQRLEVLRNEADLRFVELNPMRADYDRNLLDIAAALTGAKR